MRTSIATRANLDLLDENYERWLQNPRSVDSDWAAFFEGFELGNLPQRNGAAVAAPVGEVREGPLQTRVDGLVYAYRILGHTIARLNPLADKLTTQVSQQLQAKVVDGQSVTKVATDWLMSVGLL